MSSTFTWLDASEHDRRRAMEVIDLFRLQTTRDELGIGTVRDALAELLAPGISTIQTRARYFLIVPWIYLRLEGQRCSSSEIARRARADELQIIEALAKSSDAEGTIGIEARSSLLRLPSTIYWGGLGTLGIRLFAGSQEQYHRSLDGFYRIGDRAPSREDREAEFLGHANWHPHLPSAPRAFLSDLSLALAPEEARYLQDRFEARTPGSLIACLVASGKPIPDVQFFWDPALLGRYPSRLRAQVEHARCFSEVMHGAALLYNLMLAEARAHEEWIETYRGRLAGWKTQIEERAAPLAAWDRHAFWALVYGGNARIPAPTERFVSRWMALILDVPEPELGSAAQRKLVRDREFRLKRDRARLAYPEHLQLWNGAAGADPLDYRWGTTRRVANDILRGLAGDGAVARAA